MFMLKQPDMKSLKETAPSAVASKRPLTGKNGQPFADKLAKVNQTLAKAAPPALPKRPSHH